MKTTKLLFTLCITTLNSFAQGTWTPKANFGGGARVGAVGFSIGAKGYIGTGMDNTGTSYNDFWEWDQSTNTWTQKANFGGTARWIAVGFSIGAKGYIGTGMDNTGTSYNDFWEWDQSTNIWTQKANFGGTARYAAVGFSIGAKGYIGTGRDVAANTQDFWEWDQSTNTWTQKANFGGTARAIVVGFSIGAKGYIGTGWGAGGAYYQDFWEWDQSTNIWTQKANFGGNNSCESIGFSILNCCGKNYGYIGTGNTIINGKNSTSDFWRYDPVANTWLQVANYGGGLIEVAVGFSIGCYGYIGTGWINTNLATATNAFWEYNEVVSNAPVAVITGNNTICAGQNTTLAASGGGTYSWNNGSTNNIIVVSPSATTTYSVIVSDVCGSDTAAVLLFVTNITAGIPIIVNTNCDGQCTGSATASANGGTPTYTYSWSTVPIQNTATATGLCVGIYTCTITDANGCANNVSVTVAEIPCPCPNVKLTVPNAFSPNNDGENDKFCLQGGMDDCIKELTIIIYDRWGEKVYESSDKNFCWDGKYKGKLQNTAVFVYYLKAILADKTEIRKQGNISLIQ